MAMRQLRLSRLVMRGRLPLLPAELRASVRLLQVAVT